MKGISGWGYRPYRPALNLQEAQNPFVVRIAPHEDWFEAEFIDNGKPESGHIVSWRKMGGNLNSFAVPSGKNTFKVEGLDENTDYEFTVSRLDGTGACAPRYVRTGEVPGGRQGEPGSIVNYLHPNDDVYAFSGKALCSPSLVKLDNGVLLASMDVFAMEAPQNLTLIYRSEDGGKSWQYVTDLFPCFWGTLFTHKGRLYMQSCSTEYGDILIGESRDEGKTWSKPVKLFVGSSSNKAAGWQRTPMPIVKFNHRLWVSVDYGAWAVGGHSVGVLSIDEDADLLNSDNWSCTELISYDSAWEGAPLGKSSGLLEGSVVVSPEGKLMNIMRVGLVGCRPDHGVACAFTVDAENPEAPMTFNSFINLPSGSNSKTHILYDANSGCYLAIGNIIVEPGNCMQRNVLALQYSKDLKDWKIARILLDYRKEKSGDVGFQYVSFLVDGDDILYLSRTSLNGARNFHDANYSVLHRVKNYRDLLK